MATAILRKRLGRACRSAIIPMLKRARVAQLFTVSAVQTHAKPPQLRLLRVDDAVYDKTHGEPWMTTTGWPKSQTEH